MSTKTTKTKTELQGISSSGGPSLDKTQHNGILKVLFYNDLGREVDIVSWIDHPCITKILEAYDEETDEPALSN